MPASIFSETELARWASFPEEIPGDDLIRAFTLTGADRDLVALRRGAANRLGLALQLCVLRWLRSAQFERRSAIRRLLCRGPAQAHDGHRWLHRDRLRPVSSSEAAVRPAHPGLGRSALVSSRCSSARKEGVAVLLKGLVRSKTLLDNWDELLRVADSLKLGWVTASLLISKLQTGARENVLSRALRDPGRLVKTQVILRGIENPDYRRRIHRQLNKGEALHALRRFLFFAHEGKVQRRQADQQTNQVLCLNLVTNAIVTWNTVYMNAAIERLRAEGRIGRDIDLGHLSPALYGHVNPYGKYRFEIEGRAPSLRPLRSPGNDA